MRKYADVFIVLKFFLHMNFIEDVMVMLFNKSAK